MKFFGLSLRPWGRRRRAAQMVIEAYSLVLNRAPDPAGLSLHVTALTSGRLTGFDLICALLTSEEYRTSRHRIYPDMAAEVLRGAFLTLLGREPEQEAVAIFQARTHSEHITLSDIYGDVINSPEFGIRCLSLPETAKHIRNQKYRLDPETVPGVLEKAFLTLLNRPPDQAAIDAFVIRTHHEHLTMADVYQDIINSPEFGIKALEIPSVERHLALHNSGASANSDRSDDLSSLIYDSICTRLVRQGCKWHPAPIPPTNNSVSPQKSYALLRTLNMLAS